MPAEAGIASHWRYQGQEPLLPGQAQFAQDTGEAQAVHSDGGFDPKDYDTAWREVIESLASVDGLTVEAGREVMEDGRVVDLDLATVRKGDKTLRLVDDAQPTADTVARTLTNQGHRVFRVDAQEPGLVERILTALEE